MTSLPLVFHSLQSDLLTTCTLNILSTFDIACLYGQNASFFDFSATFFTSKCNSSGGCIRMIIECK
jgi:hypothetical protein